NNAVGVITSSRNNCRLKSRGLLYWRRFRRPVDLARRVPAAFNVRHSAPMSAAPSISPRRARTKSASSPSTASMSPEFDAAVRDFLTYLRVEAGLAKATIQAYERDLRDLVAHLQHLEVPSPRAIQPAHLAEHVRYL